MRCYYCKANISVLNKMMNGSFCRPAHRTAYLEALNRLGLARLQEARASMLKYETASSPAELGAEEPSDLHSGEEISCSEEALALA